MSRHSRRSSTPHEERRARPGPGPRLGSQARRTSAARRSWRRLASSLVLLALIGGAVPAAADEHDPHRSGHPLRVIAYVLHPVGVILDTLIFRPAHYLVSQRPLNKLFGHED